MPTNDYDRIRTGIEFMSAYMSGNELLGQYMAERRGEDDMATETLMDGAAALCAVLIKKIATDTGKTSHEVLQDFAQATHRHEQGRQE